MTDEEIVLEALTNCLWEEYNSNPEAKSIRGVGHEMKFSLFCHKRIREILESTKKVDA